MKTYLLGGLGLALLTACAAEPAQDEAVDVQSLQHQQGIHIPNFLPLPNPTGLAGTFDVTGRDVDLSGPFFTSLGTNGRSCGTCHQPTDGWTIIPDHLQIRFDLTGGTDPVFRLVDGANSPNADVSTVSKRRKAYSMLLNRGVIRIGLPMPAGAQFDLTTVDDPYHYASAAQLSLFRRPLQSANLDYLSTVMWDGRETLVDTGTPLQPGDDCSKEPFPARCWHDLPFELADQANQATLGHAQAMLGLTPPEEDQIVQFETSLYFGQEITYDAGLLDAAGATGGPEAIAGYPQYFGDNDNFGDYQTGAAFTPIIFTDYNAWSGSHDRDRAAIARGQALFNSKPITISGVGGINNLKNREGVTVLPASFSGTCGTCHDVPGGGDHSVPAPLNIGISDASRRTPDMPLYTFTCNAVGVAAGACTAGQTVQSTDPGKGLLSGAFADIGKFKGPTLRGIAARAPYFHNGSAADLGAVVDFYDTRFGIGFTKQERSDLIAFLSSL
jgi:cytochrome c peroxidase|nr:hypothetical protein [Kofleriaceae bacterium]